MGLSRPWWLATTCCGLLLAAGCAGPDQPSIVLITLDTLRADRLGAYGHPGGLTPRLDGLAAEGVLFEDATAPAPITLPSHASLFTGRYPLSTGVRNNGTFVLADQEVTLAEVLRDGGWATGAVIGAFPLKRRFGLAQGFQLYDDGIPEPRRAADGALPVHFPERNAGEVTDLALRAWESLGEGRRFLWVHYFDPHAPYAPPAEFMPAASDPPADDEAIAAQILRYDGEVAYTDREVGRLLDRVLEDDPATIVVVASDHGEALGDHGEKTHGVFLYQSTLHVPLLIRAPGLLAAGRRVGRPVSLVDVMPTVLSLVRLAPPADLDGATLSATIDAGADPAREIYAESLMAKLDFRFAELRALRAGSLKLIDAPTPELYDLGADPGETENLFASHPAARAEAARLRAFVTEREADADASGAVAAEDLARLRSLGYVAGGTAGAGTELESGRDPKEMIDYFRRHDLALGAVSEGRIDEGVTGLRALVAEAPENTMIPYQIAGALLAAGRPEEAVAEARLLVERDPAFAGGHLLLGEALFGTGELDAAAESYHRAAALLPASGDPDALLGDQWQRHGRFEQAAAAYRRAIEREPTRTDIPFRLLDLRCSRGEAGQAAEELSELAGRHGASAALWTAAGIAYRRAGNPRLALENLARAIETGGGTQARAFVTVGEIQLEWGRPDLAEQAFRRALDRRADARDGRLGLARSLLEQGRGAEARGPIEQLLLEDPTDSAAHVLDALRLERSGETAAAGAAFRRALSLDPSSSEARQGLARVAR